MEKKNKGWEDGEREGGRKKRKEERKEGRKHGWMDEWMDGMAIMFLREFCQNNDRNLQIEIIP